MRLLVVGMHNSPHLHRWVQMVARPDATILIFPSLSFPVRLPEGFQLVRLADISDATGPGVFLLSHEDSRVEGDTAIDQQWNYTPLTHSFVKKTLLSTPEALLRCVTKFRPNIVHGMETQLAGYLCAETSRRMGDTFPTWIQSTWGSDLFLFRKLPGHPERLKEVFPRVDIHLADCARDRAFAREFGYRGPEMPIIPASGGMDIDEVSALADSPPSQRKMILVKGYHNWAGRALLGFSALSLARKELEGFKIGILAARPLVKDAAKKMREAFGLDVDAVEYSLEHKDALRRLAEARLVIGLSISDGLSTTVLEGMALGAFPVQSSTGCCDEWVEHGRTGLIVSPSDTREIADAIVRAATDDALVDQAAVANLETVRRRWNISVNGRLAWEVYSRALEGGAS